MGSRAVDRDHPARVTVDGWTFVWHGGAYVDIEREGHGAIDVIGVWDYETDRPLIDRTVAALVLRVARWLAEDADAYGPTGWTYSPCPCGCDRHASDGAR